MHSMNGMGGGWFMMWPWWIVIIIGIVFFLIWASKNNSQTMKKDSALDILKKRYSRGEITKDEFEQIKKDIT